MQPVEAPHARVDLSLVVCCVVDAEASSHLLRVGAKVLHADAGSRDSGGKEEVAYLRCMPTGAHHFRSAAAQDGQPEREVDVYDALDVCVLGGRRQRCEVLQSVGVVNVEQIDEAEQQRPIHFHEGWSEELSYLRGGVLYPVCRVYSGVLTNELGRRVAVEAVSLDAAPLKVAPKHKRGLVHGCIAV